MKIVRFLLPIIGLLTLWEVVSQLGVVNPALFPAPSRVAFAFVDLISSGEMLTDIRASYFRLLIGLGIGTFFGIAVGLLTGRIKAFSSAVSPLIQVFRPLPPVAIIPLVIVWLGIGETAKIFSTAFAVFFPVWLNSHIGAQQIPERLLWSASTLTRSRWQTFKNVIFPSALPLIIAGVRTGIAIAFVMVFVTELAGASEGIGYRISTSHLAYRIDKMMAALVVLGGSGALADYLFSIGVLRIFPWLKFVQNK